MGAMITPMPQMAMAMPRSCTGKVSSRMAWEMGWSAPPPTPWMMRKTMSIPRLVAMPHNMELTVNRAMQRIRKRLRPNSADSQPVMGRMMALETR